MLFAASYESSEFLFQLFFLFQNFWGWGCGREKQITQQIWPFKFSATKKVNVPANSVDFK